MQILKDVRTHKHDQTNAITSLNVNTDDFRSPIRYSRIMTLFTNAIHWNSCQSQKQEVGHQKQTVAIEVKQYLLSFLCTMMPSFKPEITGLNSRSLPPAEGGMFTYGRGRGFFPDSVHIPRRVGRLGLCPVFSKPAVFLSTGALDH